LRLINTKRDMRDARAVAATATARLHRDRTRRQGSNRDVLTSSHVGRVLVYGLVMGVVDRCRCSVNRVRVRIERGKEEKKWKMKRAGVNK
jgi:hypothetical protein